MDGKQYKDFTRAMAFEDWFCGVIGDGEDTRIGYEF